MDGRFNKEIKAFGKRLKELRISKGMSQLDLELESGINRTEISRIENGLKNIEFATIVKLAKSLEVELADLFTQKRKSIQK